MQMALDLAGHPAQDACERRVNMCLSVGPLRECAGRGQQIRTKLCLRICVLTSSIINGPWVFCWGGGGVDGTLIQRP